MKRTIVVCDFCGDEISNRHYRTITLTVKSEVCVLDELEYHACHRCCSHHVVAPVGVPRTPCSIRYEKTLPFLVDKEFDPSKVY